MAQPSPLAFPDLQIYSMSLRVLPQLFIHNLVWPENIKNNNDCEWDPIILMSYITCTSIFKFLKVLA
jgi:hypothetical protein